MDIYALNKDNTVTQANIFQVFSFMKEKQDWSSKMKFEAFGH